MRAAGLTPRRTCTWAQLVDEILSQARRADADPADVPRSTTRSSSRRFAKRHRRRPGLVERFEAFAGGMEIANAFTELNDPDDQRARFEEQAADRARATTRPSPCDEEFLDGARARHAADRRPRARHRPPGDAPHRTATPSARSSSSRRMRTWAARRLPPPRPGHLRRCENTDDGGFDERIREGAGSTKGRVKEAAGADRRRRAKDEGRRGPGRGQARARPARRSRRRRGREGRACARRVVSMKKTNARSECHLEGRSARRRRRGATASPADQRGATGGRPRMSLPSRAERGALAKPRGRARRRRRDARAARPPSASAGRQLAAEEIDWKTTRRSAGSSASGARSARVASPASPVASSRSCDRPSSAPAPWAARVPRSGPASPPRVAGRPGAASGRGIKPDGDGRSGDPTVRGVRVRPARRSGGGHGRILKWPPAAHRGGRAGIARSVVPYSARAPAPSGAHTRCPALSNARRIPPAGFRVSGFG